MCQHESDTETAGLSQGIAQVARQSQVLLHFIDEDERWATLALGDLCATEGGLPEQSDNQRSE